MSRTAVLIVRVSPSELAEIQRLAKGQDQTASDYVRTVCLRCPDCYRQDWECMACRNAPEVTP